MWQINIHSFEKKKYKFVIKCSCYQRTTSKHAISRRWLDRKVQKRKNARAKRAKPLFSSLRMQICYLLSPSCFSKDPKFFRPISGDTIPVISSQRGGSKQSDFAIRLAFLTLKAIFFLSHWIWMGQLFNGSKKEMLSETRFSVFIDHFTDSCFVAWPLNESEAGDDLVLIKTSLLFSC